jgi:pimeloyl-ACP methyl ester carboxylesterase
MRFMDAQKLTMATLGGHGFGAKVALATAINNLNRCTGVINLDGGPLDHRYYAVYQELKSYVEIASKIPLDKLDYSNAVKQLRDKIACQKYASIFVQNLEEKNNAV